MIERYRCQSIENIWSDHHRYATWARIELAFLGHLREHKGLPAPQVTLPSQWDWHWTTQIREHEARTKHDVAAFVEWFEKYTGDRYVHYGLTSSDILDSAFSLQIKESENVLTDLARSLIGSIGQVNFAWGKCHILGRTHGQAAEAITISDKLNAYTAAIDYFLPKRRRYYGRLCGSTGDYKYFTREVEARTLSELGLYQCPLNDGQIINRAYYAEIMNGWATLASVLAKIATDLRLLAQSEICEMQEGFSVGQKGSSSMPHKMNPIGCENICGLARTIRGYQTTAMQNIELWNERDISHSSAERIIFPDTAILLGYMITRLTAIWASITINKDNIERNLSAHAAAITSQADMLKLIDQGATRNEAHALMKGLHVTPTQQ